MTRRQTSPIRHRAWDDGSPEQRDAPGILADSRGVTTTYRGGGDGESIALPSRSLQPPTPIVSGSLRERWRREVYRTPAITDGCRVVLLAMVDDMRQDGYVTVPRDQLADRLGKSERKVSQRLAEAVDARLLDRVVRGQKGRTAVYRALLRVSGTSTLNGAQGDGFKHPEMVGNRHPDGGFRVNPGGPASTKATGQQRSQRASAVEQLQSEGDRSYDVDDVDPSQRMSAADLEAQARARVAWGMTA